MSPSAPGGGEGRYAVPGGPDSAHQSGFAGRVPRNKLGITTKRLLDQAEYEAFVSVQEHYMATIIGPDTPFTARLLCQMHRDWLGGIYDWAGSYRTVNVSKGGFAWPPAHLVAQNMQALEEGVLAAHTPCPPGAVQDTARHMAVVHDDFLLVHPFRDGNGRVARWLADLMALQAGHPRPLYRFRGRGAPARRAQYLDAVKAGYREDYRLLEEFFARALAFAAGREAAP